MRAFRAALIYFTSTFVVGFLLGMVRVPFLVPRVGTRMAELLELPFMIAASFLLARWVLRRLGPFSPGQRLAVGILALVLMLAAELGVGVFVLDQSMVDYVKGRDPVSGVAYFLSLIAFAFMPLITGRQ